MDFKTTAFNVLMLVALAIPGYILVKTKLIKPKAIAYFAIALLYVNQPFLSLYSFLQVSYTPEMLTNLGIVFLLSFAVQFAMIMLLWVIFKRKYNPLQKSQAEPAKKYDGFLQTAVDSSAALAVSSDTQNRGFSAVATGVQKGKAWRVLTMTAVFGNVGFLGVPVLKVLMPLSPEAIVYSAVFIVTMNLLCWTLGAAILTGDKKYISIKKALFNPPTITLVVALPLFFLNVKLPGVVMTGIEMLANMTTPMCMLILGMRFAASPLKSLFTTGGVYVSTFIKIVAMPLLVFGILYPFDIDPTLKITMFILSAMPSASINLNLAEIFDGDQKTAANAVLLSTLLCVLTVPLLMLLVGV